MGVALTPDIRLRPSRHDDDFCRRHLPDPATWPDFLPTEATAAYPADLNCVAELLDRTAAQRADHPCLVTVDERLTYRQVLERACRIAHVLVAEHGLRSGNRVLLRGPNTAWLVATWLGVLKAGGVAVTTMPLLRTHELEPICEVSRPNLAVVDARFTAELAAVDAAVRPPMVTYGAGTADDLEIRCASAPATFDTVATSSDDVALLAFTSGTTGRPKATAHFHRDVLTIADTFSRTVLRPQADDVFTSTAPIGFTYGLGALVVFPLRAGATAVLVERPDPAELPELVRSLGVTVLFTVPTAYRVMLQRGDLPAMPALRRCVSAGEALPATVRERFTAETGMAVIDGLGSTELLHIVVSASEADIRPGCLGKAVPGYVVEVLDDSGSPVAVGETGRLAVKGPTGCRYLDGDRQDRYVQNGWNLTGDTVMRSEDGYVEYIARSDDIIVSAGYKIAGPEVENCLLQHPLVAESAVVAAPDPVHGQQVVAYVVLNDGGTAPAGSNEEVGEMLRQHVADRLARYKIPRAVRLVPQLPRTSSGKLQRYRLREGAA
jgi:2-aminobenzoate-CoA ligase